MIDKTRIAIALAAFAAAGITAGKAQAQTYGAAYSQQPPLYPYAVAPQQPYAVEVSPGVYVIRRPPAADASSGSRPRQERNALRDTEQSERPRKPADRALIDELRQRSQSKEQVRETTINTHKIVREAPIVRETTRVVDDPPRIVERRHIAEDLPPVPSKRRARAEAAEAGNETPTGHGDSKQRVIRAEAEVTILGPDRMSIRLFRKPGAANANASTKAQGED